MGELSQSQYLFLSRRLKIKFLFSSQSARLKQRNSSFSCGNMTLKERNSCSHLKSWNKLLVRDCSAPTPSSETTLLKIYTSLIFLQIHLTIWTNKIGYLNKYIQIFISTLSWHLCTLLKTYTFHFVHIVNEHCIQLVEPTLHIIHISFPFSIPSLQVLLLPAFEKGSVTRPPLS